MSFTVVARDAPGIRPWAYAARPTTTLTARRNVVAMTQTTGSTTAVRAARPGLVHRHPLLCFAVPAVAITWALQLSFLAAGLPLFPAMILELVVLVGCATTVTGLTSGRPGVRALFAGVLRWRFSPGYYALALLAMPVVTMLVAVVAGTFDGSAGSWAGQAAQYAFLTVVFGAVLGNVWEELAWTGFLQQRLTDERGLLVGALLTAVPFGLIHLPLAFEAGGLGGTSLGSLALSWALLLAVAPFFRYLIGLVWSRTGRSLLSVALLHGSFNACGGLAVATGGWEYIPAAAVLTLVVAGVMARRPITPAAS
jgi:membrane protease YdiL (CAAX protease family)